MRRHPGGPLLQSIAAVKDAKERSVAVLGNAELARMLGILHRNVDDLTATDAETAWPVLNEEVVPILDWIISKDVTPAEAGGPISLAYRCIDTLIQRAPFVRKKLYIDEILDRIKRSLSAHNKMGCSPRVAIHLAIVLSSNLSHLNSGQLVALEGNVRRLSTIFAGKPDINWTYQRLEQIGEYRARCLVNRTDSRNS